MPRTLPLAPAHRARSSKQLAARIVVEARGDGRCVRSGQGVVTQKPALLRKRNPERDAMHQIQSGLLARSPPPLSMGPLEPWTTCTRFFICVELSDWVFPIPHTANACGSSNRRQSRPPAQSLPLNRHPALRGREKCTLLVRQVSEGDRTYFDPRRRQGVRKRRRREYESLDAEGNFAYERMDPAAQTKSSKRGSNALCTEVI
jgi:hypothetical protein